MPNLDRIDPGGLESVLVDLIHVAPLPQLGDKPYCERTASLVKTFLKTRMIEGTSIGAGLWLLTGDLDRSHSISQDLHDADGSYWHAMMHRREGDYWNSKYWLRRIPGHPVFNALASTFREAFQLARAHGLSADDDWQGLPVELLFNPDTVSTALVDAVEKAQRNPPKSIVTLQTFCWWEWQLQFKHCWSKYQESAKTE